MRDFVISKNTPKLRAALIHLSLTIVVAISAAMLVFFMWYPSPLHLIAGGLELFGILACVDLLLGPMLTLIVFDPSKTRQSLFFDLSVIASVQCAALIYGVCIVYEARPVVLAFEGERFRLVPAIGVVHSELSLAQNGLGNLSLTGPRLVNAVIPNDSSERADAAMMALSGFDIGTRPKFWRAWDESARAAVQATMRKFNPSQMQKCLGSPGFREGVARTHHQLEQLAFLPLLGGKDDWVVLVKQQTGEPIGYAPFNC